MPVFRQKSSVQDGYHRKPRGQTAALPQAHCPPAATSTSLHPPRAAPTGSPSWTAETHGPAKTNVIHYECVHWASRLYKTSHTRSLYPFSPPSCSNHTMFNFSSSSFSQPIFPNLLRGEPESKDLLPCHYTSRQTSWCVWDRGGPQPTSQVAPPRQRNSLPVTAGLMMVILPNVATFSWS